MATPTYTPLATQNITSNTANFTFSSIPQTYRDLILVISGTVSATQDVSLNVINGSGAVVNYESLTATGSSRSVVSGSDDRLTPNISPQAGDRYTLIVQFFDYSQNNKFKEFISRYSNASRGVNINMLNWDSTAAITSFNLEGFFTTGTTLSLYGIE